MLLTPSRGGYNAAVQQTEHRQPPSHRLPTCVRIAVAALLLIGGATVAAQAPTWLRMYKLNSANPEVRRAAVRELGGREGYAAVPAIRHLITADPDPDVRQAAAYAAMKLGDQQAAESIRRAVVEQPDGESTAMMLASLARLCGPTPEAIAFVDECGRSGKPYRVAGAAMARTEWFQPAGVRELLALGQSGTDEFRAFVRERLRQYLIPTAQMVGVVFDGTDPWPPERFAAMESWWNTQGTERLLRDGLWPKRGRDADIREIERLLHDRERIGHLLGLL